MSVAIMRSGFILYLLFNNNFNLLTINQNKYHALIMLYLSIGAGIFEEFIFRFIFIRIISFVLVKYFKLNKYKTFFPLLFLSSFFFSGFHYIGMNGMDFEWYSFYLKFCAGTYLGLIFFFRGFAICSITHIVYNFIIINGMN